MIEIQLTINRKFIFEYNKTIQRQIPQSWQDLPHSQKIDFLKIITFLTKNGAHLAIIERILKLPKSDFLRVYDDDIDKVAELTEWLFNEPTTTPIFASFNHKGIEYHMPAPDFANGIAYEFALADDALTNWQNEPKNEMHLLRLAAILARPAKDDPLSIERSGDIRRELFSEYEAEARAKYFFYDLDFAYVLSVLNYFQAVKKKVHTAGVALGIFDPPQLTKENELIETPGHDPLFGWWTCFRNIAKTAVMGNEEQVWRANFWRIFAFLKEEKKRHDDMEAVYKKAGRNS